MDRESLRFWRVTPSDLAELAAGGPLDALSGACAARSRSQALPEAAVDAGAQAHVATSDAPVVNTLWKVREMDFLLRGLIARCIGQAAPNRSAHGLHGAVYRGRAKGLQRWPEGVVCGHAQASPVTHVDISAQASCRSHSGLMHTASGTVMV